MKKHSKTNRPAALESFECVCAYDARQKQPPLVVCRPRSRSCQSVPSPINSWGGWKRLPPQMWKGGGDEGGGCAANPRHNSPATHHHKALTVNLMLIFCFF